MSQEQAKTDLVNALIAFKKDFPKSLSKNKEAGQGQFSYSYLDYAAIRDAVDGLLAKHGLVVTHHVKHGIDGAPALLETTLKHKSGEEVSDGGIPLLMNKHSNPMQALGSAITYSKRYGIMMILGLSAQDEDDDAQSLNHEDGSCISSHGPSMAGGSKAERPFKNQPGTFTQSNPVSPGVARYGLIKGKPFKDIETKKLKEQMDFWLAKGKLSAPLQEEVQNIQDELDLRSVNATPNLDSPPDLSDADIPF